MSAETVTITKAGLDALREDRNELSRNYRTLANEADKLRRQRDEALQALRDLRDAAKWESDISASMVTNVCDEVLAQYEEGDA